MFCGAEEKVIYFNGAYAKFHLSEGSWRENPYMWSTFREIGISCL